LELVGDKRPLVTESLNDFHEPVVLVKSPIVLLEGWVKGLAITLRTGVVCPTFNAPGNGGPFGPEFFVQPEKHLVLFVRPRALLYRRLKRMQPALCMCKNELERRRLAVYLSASLVRAVLDDLGNPFPIVVLAVKVDGLSQNSI